ncbi:hypothetical protein [Devosia submarina]|uniref:hypothetical protein n=1 Tax=Devosia submarina TaxID=1173082 RepID=UPI000D3D5C06|nr:hypothetical protein [Devosia submarina]
MAIMDRTQKRRPNISHGANPLTYRPSIKTERASAIAARMAAWNRLSEEAKQERQREWREHEEDLAQWRKDFDKFGPAKAREMLEQRRDGRAALNRIKDMEARVAVEGDTDLNHDNIEAAE